MVLLVEVERNITNEDAACASGLSVGNVQVELAQTKPG